MNPCEREFLCKLSTEIVPGGLATSFLNSFIRLLIGLLCEILQVRMFPTMLTILHACQ